MKRRIIVFLAAAFCFLPAAVFAQKIVAVSDFTTTDPGIEPKMRGVADAVRAEFARSNMVRLVDRSNFEQVFNELAQQRMGFTDPASVKRIGAMLNADYLVVGSVTREGNTESLDVFGPGITASLALQMIDVETGRVVTSEVLRPASWDAFAAAVPRSVQNMISRIPRQAQNTFGGKWEASIEHDGIEDIYEFDFRADGRCTATIFSYGRDGAEKKQSADGTYSLAPGQGGDILSVNVNFRRAGAVLSHLTRIEWKVIFSMSGDRDSFNIVIPVSSRQNAARTRATFRKM